MKIEMIDLEQLVPYENNPRINDGAVDAVAKSIQQFGWRAPIVCDEKMVIVCGHTRHKAAAKLGLQKVPVHVVTDLTPTQIKAYRIADNQTATLAEWDFDLLPIELRDLQDSDYDLDLLGFDEYELAHLLDGDLAEGLTDEDAVPDTPEVPVTVEGDVWLLGRHRRRVMCGDSTSIDAVEKLMGGQKADMVFTDPPYRMDAEGGSAQPIGRAAAKLGENIKHLCDFDPVEFLQVLPTAFSSGVMNAYVFCNKDLVPDYLKWAVESKYNFNILFWKKPSAIPLGGQHRPDVEYLIKFGRSAIWNNGLQGVSYSKCLEFGREGDGRHPTIKPVALIENEVLISSRTTGFVLDLFGGSGSTLIACEKTNRQCYMMEIDPLYSDVILQRWSDFTGQDPVLERTGDKFSELKNARD